MAKKPNERLHTEESDETYKVKAAM